MKTTTLGIRSRVARSVLGAALLAVLAAFDAAHAANVTVISYDGAGEGFNDPTPIAPVGGNPGTTIGAQRFNAFQHAADIWGALIDSPVVIRVGARFDPLSCSASSAVLGSAGPTNAVRDFAGAPVANTWFAVALGNSLFGSDLIPNTDDVSATFNSAIGTTCPFPLGWYYGLDGNPPGNQLDFVTVVLHEMGHGLGFLTFVDLGAGTKLGGLDDTFMRHLEDHTTGKMYPAMSNAERVTASTNTGNLHWVGPEVAADSGVLTAGRVGDHVRMFAPAPQQGGSSVSHFDDVLTPNEPMEPRYTGPRHTLGLTVPALQDMGWRQMSPAISVTPPSVDYGGVLVGAVLSRKVTVHNDGTAPLTVGQITLGGANPSQFRQPAAADLCSGTVLAPGGSCTLKVKLKPSVTGPLSATLVIPSDDPDQGVVTLPLSGVGQTPQIALSPLAISFGSVVVGGTLGQKVAVMNSGNADLVIGQIMVDGVNPDQFREPVVMDLCSGLTIPPGGSCTLKVQFKPTLVGPLSATLAIPSTASNGAVATVTLTGTGMP